MEEEPPPRICGAVANRPSRKSNYLVQDWFMQLIFYVSISPFETMFYHMNSLPQLVQRHFLWQ
jgi:hypothetical protein